MSCLYCEGSGAVVNHHNGERDECTRCDAAKELRAAAPDPAVRPPAPEARRRPDGTTLVPVWVEGRGYLYRPEPFICGTCGGPHRTTAYFGDCVAYLTKRIAALESR